MAGKEATTCWTNEETKVLISLYGDQDTQNKLGEVYRNQNVFEDLAKSLLGHGFRKTANQCRGKIKNLKAKYKQVRDHNARSGRNQITCSFFEELDAILRDHPSSRPKPVLNTAVAVGDEETLLSEGDSEEDISIDGHVYSTLAPRKRQVRFSARHDIILLREVITQNPFASKEPGPAWARVGEVITSALQDENFVVDARRCRERTMLLLEYYKKQDFPSLRRFGTERLYAQKEDLLHEVLELEAERGLFASGENTNHQNNERMIRPIDEETVPEEEKPNITITQTHVTEPEDDPKEMETSAAPTAKQPCQCCCQTYSEILGFLEKRSEAEQRLREEELALRREELEIQRSKITLERERLGAERRERERRFELESQERQVILDLLKEKVLKG